MTHKIYSRTELPFDRNEGYQTYGDWLFFKNGSVQLGGKFFSYRTPIHCHRFGGNIIAKRRIDRPELVEIDVPQIGPLYFVYRYYHRHWCQLVEIDDPLLYLHAERYGREAAKMLLHLRRFGQFLWVNVLGYGVLFLAIYLIAKLFD